MKPNYKKIPIHPELIKKARLIELAGDPTRMRILCFMFEYDKACVSDIAESLDMSVNAVSHHLQIMRDNGYFETHRIGNMVCYMLIRNEFTKQLEKLICG
ncbi:MAG: winged helix-turn-helix transcriptional regulator [Candidatus Magasanikbacteria bacterium]|nr:winged helix-turn-helix transcriptional regulator [Candidatus Magasanikbacteria bacterium]